MYLIYCAIAFLVISYYSRFKFEWFVLAILYVLLWCNKEYFLKTDDLLYIIRAALTYVSANILIYKKSKLALYQAFILFIILLAYGCLSYDVSMQKHILIYNNYEAVIHGLVCCQLLGVLPEIWRCCYNHYSSNQLDNKHNQRL